MAVTTVEGACGDGREGNTEAWQKDIDIYLFFDSHFFRKEDEGVLMGLRFIDKKVNIAMENLQL